MLPEKDDILKHAMIRTSRSGGSGGQHVNKVSSKVELVLNIAEAPFLNEEEKELVQIRLANKIDQEGNLHVVAQESRSQLSNKETAVLKMIYWFKTALHTDKVRKPNKIPRSVIRKRLADKQIQASKKESRRKPFAG